MNHVADGESSVQALLYIQIGRRLVEHEYVTVLNAHHRNGETLQFSTWQGGHFTILNVRQIQPGLDMKRDEGN